jgi:hypothetical protein
MLKRQMPVMPSTFQASNPHDADTHEDKQHTESPLKQENRHGGLYQKRREQVPG